MTATIAETVQMTSCAHCGVPLNKKAKAGWSIHDVPHNNGSVVTVAVCPRCRVGNRIPEPEQHEAGTCNGHYSGTDAFTAKCTELNCKQQWSCWEIECVEQWCEEHWQDCECPDDLDGHHNATVTKPAAVSRP